MPHPIVIGIVGGIASGKSEVAKALEALGAVRIDADQIGHGLLRDDRAVLEAVVALLGPSILDEQGAIDRRQVASRVFGDDEVSRKRLSELEAILHPAIRQQVESQIAQWKKEPSFSMIVIDAPLLIEAGWKPLCDELIFVDAPIDLRERLSAERGWSPDELARRESAQMSLAQKRAAATYVIDNYGSIDELRSKTQELVAKWISSPKLNRKT
jgi:dephospho-CoA kinase